MGSLMSKYYRLRSPYVGLAVLAMAVGALLACPFQKAGLFSRSRTSSDERTDSMKFSNKVTWTSHFWRRVIFTICLPLAGIAYAGISVGPPMHKAVPIVITALIGFLSCLAVSECNGLIMETFDTSDLEPGMTGRPRARKSSGGANRAEAAAQKRTNYSSFPRVTAGFACAHTFGFIFAAGATGIGGVVQRNLGQRASTFVYASILMLLSILLLLVLLRFRDVQIIPRSKTMHVERWRTARRKSWARHRVAVRRSLTGAIRRGAEGHRQQPMQVPSMVPGPIHPDDDPRVQELRPTLMGNPSGKSRRMNVLEMGSQTRWTEIRRRNNLIDKNAHVNKETLELAGKKIEETAGSIKRGVSKRGRNAVGIPDKSGPSETSASSSSFQRAASKTGSSSALGSHGAAAADTLAPPPLLGRQSVEVFRQREPIITQTVMEQDEVETDDDAEVEDQCFVVGSDESGSEQGESCQLQSLPHANTVPAALVPGATETLYASSSWTDKGERQRNNGDAAASSLASRTARITQTPREVCATHAHLHSSRVQPAVTTINPAEREASGSGGSSTSSTPEPGSIVAGMASHITLVIPRRSMGSSGSQEQIFGTYPTSNRAGENKVFGAAPAEDEDDGVGSAGAAGRDTERVRSDLAGGSVSRTSKIRPASEDAGTQ